MENGQEGLKTGEVLRSRKRGQGRYGEVEKNTSWVPTLMVCLFTAYTTSYVLGKPQIYYYIHIQNKWCSRFWNIKFMINTLFKFYIDNKKAFSTTLWAYFVLYH